MLVGFAMDQEDDLLEVEDDVRNVLFDVGNSCSTPEIFTAEMAAPSNEDRSTRLSELPKV